MHVRLKLAGSYSSATRPRTTPAPRRVSRLGTSLGEIAAIWGGKNECIRRRQRLDLRDGSVKKKEMTEFFVDDPPARATVGLADGGWRLDRGSVHRV
jgi:hypothetical protein